MNRIGHKLHLCLPKMLPFTRFGICSVTLIVVFVIVIAFQNVKCFRNAVLFWKVADPSFRGTLGHRKILKIRAQTLEYSILRLVLTARNMEMNFVNSTMHDDACNLYKSANNEHTNKLHCKHVKGRVNSIPIKGQIVC